MATYLLFIGGGLCLLLFGGGLLIIKRQQDDLARKAKELKRQKFLTNRTRIAEEIANRLQAGAITPAAASREPPAQRHQPAVPPAAKSKPMMPPAPPLTAEAAPPPESETHAPSPRSAEAHEISRTPPQIEPEKRERAITEGRPAAITQAGEQPAAPLSHPLVAQNSEEPDIPLGVKPEMTAAAQNEREQAASASINAASLTGLLAEANKSRLTQQASESLPQTPADFSPPPADTTSDTDIKPDKHRDPATQIPRRDVKAGRGLPPYATPPTVKLPPVNAVPAATPVATPASIPAPAPTPASATSRPVKGEQPQKQFPQLPQLQPVPKSAADQHVSWQPLANDSGEKPARTTVRNGNASPPGGQRGNLPPGQPAIGMANGTASASISPFHPNPDLSLYDQLAAYASWVASQSDQFILERHADEQPNELIPLLMTKEDLQRLNGHWFGLFKPRDLSSLYKEMQRNECEIYFPFNKGDITELKRPAEDILAYVEAEDSARYRQVIKESKLAEFIGFLEELDTIV